MAQAGGMGEATQNMSQYTYKASLDSQDGLSPGYHVSLQVNLENKKMVAVPTKSIVEKTMMHLFMLRIKEASQTECEKGSTDGDWTEITEGVTVGQKVVKILPTMCMTEWK